MSATSPQVTSTEHPRYTAYVCSHTHWDREWYGSFQQFRYRFVRLVDRLLDMLEANPEYRCFNLDGQTIALEDYLEVKPEQRPRLEKFIRERRILIGPWYILPDEWLVSGESTIRNYLRGRAGCREFGVEPPNVGYLPDMFGHLSQIPQLLRGLGMDNAIFWRGLSGDEWMTELWWEGSDGSRVLGIHLPEYCGYCNFAFFLGSLPPETRAKLPADTSGAYMVTADLDYTVDAVRDIADRAIAKSRSAQLLFMNGVDHMEPQAQTSEILRRAAERYPDLELRHATFQEFIDAVRDSTPADLQVVKGEHRSTVVARESSAIIIQNILSSRIHLKIANATCQTLLERWVEPFASAAAILGHSYPQGLIHTAWKMLLRNHPHDSIGGCSIDEVHYQMEARFSEVEDLATLLTVASLHEICGDIRTDDLPEDELPYFLFNPLNWTVSELVTVQIDIDEDWLKKQGITIHPDNIYRTLRNLRIAEWDGTPVEFHVQHIEYITSHRPWISSFAPLFMVARFTVALAARDLPPLGYKGYRIGLPKKERRLADRHGSTNPAVLANEHIRVEIHGDGTLAISGEAAGSKTLTGLHYFEDGGDNGDGYTYSPPRHDAVVTSRRSRTQITRLHDERAIQAVAVDYDLELPASVTADRQHRSPETVIQRIRSIFRLGPDSKRLDVETTLTNVAKDHRLRVCFDVTGKSDSHSAEMHFDVLERPNQIEQPSEEVWMEDMPLERPQQAFVSYEHLAVANFGLPEYEIVPGKGESVLKLTLLRAVNYLGAGGHANTIVGGAGPYIETPQQQLLGRTYTFRYSIIPHDGRLEKNDVQRQAHQHNALWRGYMSDRHSGFLSGSGNSFFEVTGDNIVLSAIKQVENAPGEYVVRVWSSGVKASTAVFKWHRPPHSAQLANLAEEALQELELKDGTAQVEVNPKQIVTVRFTSGKGK